MPDGFTPLFLGPIIRLFMPKDDPAGDVISIWRDGQGTDEEADTRDLWPELANALDRLADDGEPDDNRDDTPEGR